MVRPVLPTLAMQVDPDWYHHRSGAPPVSHPAARRPPLWLVREDPPAYENACDASDFDPIEDLGDRIATLAAHIHAATHRLLVLIAEFDRREGWKLDGHRSCAHWLAFRTGIDLGTAREKVRTARALDALPETGASMARGELSFSQVRALTRVASTENEADLLELARGSTVAQLERMVRGFRRGSLRDEAEREKANHESRAFSIFPDEEGMYLVRGRLEPEVAAVLMKAVEAASDALYREREVPGLLTDEESRRAAAQRRADAVGLLAERALAAGFGGTGEDDAVADVPISGSRAERFQVMLHIEADADGAHLDDGTRVSYETSRRLMCDASLVSITHATDGSVLDVGRRRRTTPPALRRALETRDRGCRFPGCGSRFTDAHHVKHWTQGGETKLDNTILLCRVHHRLLHEGGWRLVWWGKGRAVFIDPRNGEHFDGGWEPPRLEPEPVDALVEEQRAHGIDPDWRTAGARWKREGDIPGRVWVRAMEGLG